MPRCPPKKVTTTTNSQSNLPPTTVTNHDYATELLSIKMEINTPKTLITDAVDQFKTAIASLATTTNSQSSNMDTDVHESMKHQNNNQNPVNLAALIQDLKYEIATIITEMRAMFA